MSTRIPQSISTVSYGYTINSDGKPIGTLQGFNPSMNRTLERVRQLKASDTEDTFELLPGRTELSITVDKLELYASTLVDELLQTPNTSLLVNDTRTFNIEETIKNTGISTPGATGGTLITKTVTYHDCRIQSYTKRVQEGTVTVTENAVIIPKRVTSSTTRP